MGTHETGPPTDRRRAAVLSPRRWSIAARSAAVSALIVLVSLGLATAILLALLYGSLMSVEDDACANRVTEIAAALYTEGPAALDSDLFATDRPLVAVQVVARDGQVVRKSAGAPTAPMVPPAQWGPSVTRGVPGTGSGAVDIRVAGMVIDGVAGEYVVLVGADGSAPRSTVRTAALLGIAIFPLILVETALVNYLLIKRSMQSVDAIRVRVAEVSTSDLAGRVPVPDRHDEIAALANTMNDMLGRLEDGHATQRRFVGDASHELRSPLSGIVSTLEVVEAHPQLLSYELVVETLLPQAHRMTDLVDDLLLLARADEHALVLRRDIVDMSDLVAEEVARLQAQTLFTVSAEVADVRVIGDRNGLSRVLRNLGDNAVRHARSRIEIAVTADGADVSVAVSDDGPGIPPADRGRVFDRFVRLDSDRSRRSGGTGLGLAIVAEIVASHGGTVRIGTRPGGGARITVSLTAAV